jgi:hypothetical protein
MNRMRCVVLIRLAVRNKLPALVSSIMHLSCKKRVDFLNISTVVIL